MAEPKGTAAQRPVDTQAWCSLQAHYEKSKTSNFDSCSQTIESAGNG